MKYYYPTSLAEYFDLRLRFTGMEVTLLAGGTDLIPRYERDTPLPDHLIDLKKIPQLSSIVVSDEQIEIGALTSIQAIHDHSIISDEFTALYEAAHDFAGAQIRHRGTIGGNICNASPAGDLLPALYAFETSIGVVGKAGMRTLPISEFIVEPGKTALNDGELVSSVFLPRRNLKSRFQKVGLRQSMAISVLNVAFVWEAKNDEMKSLKIAAGAVAPTVVTLDAFVSAYLDSPAELSHHMSLIDEAISPIDDIRATANYRRTVLKNLIKDFLKND